MNRTHGNHKKTTSIHFALATKLTIFGLVDYGPAVIGGREGAEENKGKKTKTKTKTKKQKTKIYIYGDGKTKKIVAKCTGDTVGGLTS